MADPEEEKGLESSTPSCVGTECAPKSSAVSAVSVNDPQSLNELKSEPIEEPEPDPIRKSSKERRLQYLRNGIDADCEVHVQSADPDADAQGGNVCYKKFRCHRLLLATASDKLEQDVYQNKKWNGVLQINGVSPEAVEIFLEFIYTFEVSTSKVELQLIGDIFILSCAYNMPEMLCSFADKVKDKDWPLDYIFPAYDLAFRHNIISLEQVCMTKILEHARELAIEPTLMNIQIYALNFVIQHWLAAKAIPTNEMVEILLKYQRENEINFSNTQQFPHFTKIINYFRNVLLDADGIISKYEEQ
ncbi:uncharacterized protein LOC115622028 [Scaptodrosophila lebanonensis]|uniref:Uncharacterized protein LOC115622028 n=1 Tax=Drosophila lebanonensis TaxID=7225 RepID=A0A6J2T499_DROLE|nr:uncharacterized protein LOC115622028 [Scaptodrosophila lebanonensis]